ncbi:MAG: LysM peptidoglycan-binding domain-containing protein [Desulfobacteraceae bacterium]|nr:LysM peptidoglycan-binding domain-containing protein [Desulfobacteraceae bacterium]
MNIERYVCRTMLVTLLIGMISLVCMHGMSYAQESEKNTQQDIQYETGFYYTIKKGDTLWDISQHFSDSAWQWPDLWSDNDQIPNPHWIYPGERIRLYRKKDSAKRTEGIPQPAPQVQTSMEMPEADQPKVEFLYNQLNEVGFIRKPAVNPTGVIFKCLRNKKLISFDDVVYIKNPEKGTVSGMQPGSRWTIYRLLSPTKDKQSQRTIGSQHYLLGVVEITENNKEYAIGRIIKSYRRISVGDLLMPYKPKSIEVIVSESAPGIKGHIIGSEEHTALIGEYFIAFIDKGKQDKIIPGQLYNIYEQDEMIDSKGKKLPLKPVDIGSLIVLRTEKTTSTVLITASKAKIVPDTKIRTP